MQGWLLAFRIFYIPLWDVQKKGGEVDGYIPNINSIVFRRNVSHYFACLFR